MGLRRVLKPFLNKNDPFTLLNTKSCPNPNFFALIPLTFPSSGKRESENVNNNQEINRPIYKDQAQIKPPKKCNPSFW